MIAEDEPMLRAMLRARLAEAWPDLCIVAEAANGAEALAEFSVHRPDVAFLDIRMPLETGLDVARHREHRARTLVVFVTAFDKFALPAFETDAVDYLTKPLTESRLVATLDRVRERVETRRNAERFVEGAGASVDEPAAYPSRLVTRVGLTDVVIPIETIDYIQADDVYAAVVSRAKRQLVRAPLDTLEQSLDPRVFVRVHRSYIVRIDRVVALRRRPRGGAELVVEGGAVLPVSRRRRARVARLLSRS